MECDWRLVMTETLYFVVETIAESLETDRHDLTNEVVMTLPVVAGPYDTYEEAEINGIPAGDDSGSYTVVTYHED